MSHLADLLQGKVLFGKPRAENWLAIRDAYVASGHGRCAVCGGTKHLEVHHIKPFHLYPELELTPSNFLTLCTAKKRGLNCHLLIGHLGNYRNENTCVLVDAEYMRQRLASVAPLSTPQHGFWRRLLRLFTP